MNCKTQNQYSKTNKNIMEIYRRNRNRMVDLVKILLKKDSSLPFSTSEIILNFFKKIFNFNKKRLGMGFLLNQNIMREMSSDSFGLGVADLLTDLTMPLVLKDNLFQKVDLGFSLKLINILKDCDVHYFSSIEDIDELIPEMQDD